MSCAHTQSRILGPQLSTDVILTDISKSYTLAFAETAALWASRRRGRYKKPTWHTFAHNILLSRVSSTMVVMPVL